MRCGIHMTFVVDGGHGQPSEMVGEGACEMITGDESCCSLMALAMYLRAGEPLTLMAE